MISSKITAVATLALALVLIGSIITGHLFVVNALLPDTASIKITSPPKGQAIPVGNLTISGTSSDNITTNCQVYAGWNDLKPYHTAVANGAGGADDYSKWAFRYTNTYHAITNGTNKLTAKLSCDDSTGSLAKWDSVNVTGVTPVVASSSQSTTNITKLLAAIQGQQNSTDKLQEAVFRSLQVQVPTISEIKKSSTTQLEQQQQQQGITPQELQNELKISLDNLSPKQKSMLTQPQIDLLKTMSPQIQKGLSPQQGTQVTSLLRGLTQNVMGPSYNIFDRVGGTANLGIKLIRLYDSGKLRFPDVLAGIGAIIFSSHTGLNPDVMYEVGKGLLSHLSSQPRPTTQAANVGSPIITTDKGGNKVELGGYNCTKEGCGYYQDGICKTCGKPGADRAQTDAIRDAQGLNGHGYDSKCPSGQSAGFCGDYKQAYDKHWEDLHSSVPTPTSNSLTTEKPTTTAEQPMPTPDKSFQNGVQQQLSVPQKSETSGQEIAGTPSVNNPPTTNPTTSSDNELNQQGLGGGSNTPSTNPPNTLKQDTGTGLNSVGSGSNSGDKLSIKLFIYKCGPTHEEMEDVL